MVSSYVSSSPENNNNNNNDSLPPTSPLYHQEQQLRQQYQQKVLHRAIQHMDPQELDRLIDPGSWLASMLVNVETLPVCVSIATATKQRLGFPLVYVNAAFEKTTGYLRSEIIGQNCRFLQANKAEPEAIIRLTNALRDAKPIRLAITNYRKDGIPFKNLLAMKPIFDENGRYRYVVGVQFDVTQSDSTPEKLQLANQIIQLIPDIIVASENDDDTISSK
jgi:PAS domain S-box-containing protein